VAEVTSLGLVQMTRKRLGLGLLETFSEACEVCAGRGLIVHHEPVTKHRSSNDSGPNNGGNASGNSRRRGGNTGGNGNQRGGTPAKSGPSAGTHAITDDVSRALAAIAAKTVTSTATGAITLPPATDAPAEPTATPESSTPNKATTAPADATPAVEVLDLPAATKPARNRAAIDAKSADELLGSVLESLPEPPAPGTRKRASRRVTSGTITTQGPTDQPA
jgi:ribonuclease E